jgi:hypothetical protein
MINSNNPAAFIFLLLFFMISGCAFEAQSDLQESIKISYKKILTFEDSEIPFNTAIVHNKASSIENQSSSLWDLVQEYEKRHGRKRAILLLRNLAKSHKVSSIFLFRRGVGYFDDRELSELASQFGTTEMFDKMVGPKLSEEKIRKARSLGQFSFGY